MRTDRSAKSRRRTVALANLKKQLEAWKNAKSDDAILALISTKNATALGDSPTSENLQFLRKNKINNSKAQIEILEQRL